MYAHLGASTEEAQTQVAVEAVELAIDYLTTGAVRHAVNVAAIDPKTLESLAGYLELAYRMGIFLDQWDEGGVQAVQVEYRGHVANEDTKLLTASLCRFAKRSIGRFSQHCQFTGAAERPWHRDR